MIGIMIDQKLSRYENCIKYTCDFIFETLGITHRYIEALDYQRNDEIVLLYSLLSPDKDELVELSRGGSVIFMQVEPDLLDMSKVSREFIEKYTQTIKLFNPCPVVSTKSFDNPVEIHKIGDYSWSEINFDLIANVFYHLSGCDDKLVGERDELGRYRDTNLAFLSYSRTPFVDYLLWIMEGLIKDIANETASMNMLQKEMWPIGEDFAYTITHNVDQLQKWDLSSFLKSMFSDVYKLISFKLPLLYDSVREKVKYLFTNYEFYWRFSELRHIMVANSLRNTWFIAALDENDEEPDHNAIVDYLFDDPDLHEELKLIINDHGEVALLTDVLSGQPQDLERQVKRLGNTITSRVKGIRNVAGTFDNDKTDENLEETEFIYDATRRLIDQVGFRHGIGSLYRPYLARSGKSAKHWVVPFIFSDDYLQINNYRVVSFEKAKVIVRGLIKAVRETNGVITFNFSMSLFNDIKYMPRFLEQTVNLLKSLNGYNASLSEIVEWWDKRSRVKISKNKNEFHIKVPDKMKALTISLWGGNKLKKVTGAKYYTKKNMITLLELGKNSSIVVQTVPDDQMYLDIDR